MLKVAIAGCGLVSSKKHIPAFLKLKNKVKIVAVCDLNETLAKEVAQRFSIEKHYNNFSNLLNTEKPDVVVICTPPQTHAKLAMEAMEHGSHVLLEKPMALNSNDCDLMNEVSVRTKRKICIMHNQIFNPALQRGKKLFLEGMIGDFVGMNLVLSTPVDYMTSIKDHWSHKLPGGVLGETGPHVVYLAKEFIGNIYDVDVFTKKHIPEYSWSNYEDFRIVLMGESGIGTVSLIYASNNWMGKLEIIGSRGTLSVDLQAQTVIKYERTKLKAMTVGLSLLSEVLQLLKEFSLNTMNYFIGKRSDAHSVGVEQFVESILHDKPFPVSGFEGRDNVRVMEMLVDKMKNKKYEFARSS